VLLVLDVGNTNIVAGLYQGESLVHTWRMATHRHRTADEYGMILRTFLEQGAVQPVKLSGVAIGSVVPDMNHVLLELCRRYLEQEPFMVRAHHQNLMPVAIDHPRELGADLIAGAVAAYRLVGGPLAVVDFGTATTISAVSAAGTYLGALISPGLRISADALFRNAPHLGNIALEPPPAMPGTNTIHALQGGIFWGHAATVDGLLDRLAEILGPQMKVVATGGLAVVMKEHCRWLERIEPNLVLDGIRQIYEAGKA